MDEDDEEFVPRKRSKKAGGSILDQIHLQPKYVAIIVAIIAFFAIGAFLDIFGIYDYFHMKKLIQLEKDFLEEETEDIN